MSCLIRSIAALALAGSLVACSTDAPPLRATPVAHLAMHEVRAGDGDGGRAWDGVVEAVREARLSAQTPGRVLAVARDVNDVVAAGDVLVRLSEVEQRAGVDAARARLRAAEAAWVEAGVTHRRYLELADRHFVSKAQLDQVVTNLDAARAARDAAGANLAQATQQNDYTTIRAPYAGVVGARAVEPGESVDIGQVLMTVFAPDVLRIEVSVPQSDAEAIRAEPVARIGFDDGRRIESADVIVYPGADAATHAVRVRVQLPRLEPAPRPGTTAKVSFRAVRGVAWPRVPASALVQRGEVNAVYVLVDGRPSLRQVRLGDRSEDAVDVIAGLEPGETIAADPLAALQALVAARGGD